MTDRTDRTTTIAGVFFLAVSLGLIVWWVVDDAVKATMFVPAIMALFIGLWFLSDDDGEEDDAR